MHRCCRLGSSPRVSRQSPSRGERRSEGHDSRLFSRARRVLGTALCSGVSNGALSMHGRPRSPGGSSLPGAVYMLRLIAVQGTLDTQLHSTVIHSAGHPRATRVSGQVSRHMNEGTALGERVAAAPAASQCNVFDNLPSAYLYLARYA